jgi:periplasmic protein TonB
MNTLGTIHETQDDPFGSGIAGAVALHLLLLATIITIAFVHHSNSNRFGSDEATVGAIQASMVSAIPLPAKAPPVDKSVLTSEDTSPAPAPPPKEATQPPPRPDDILIKSKTEKVPTKVAPVPTIAPPKHPQPTPVTPKAQTGDVATQLPQSISQLRNGSSTLTVESRTFGNRYAYYLQIVSRNVNANYNQQEIDARASQGKSVTVIFDINHDGSPSNVRVENRSGSPSLDAAATRAIQLIDSFGPLPEGDHITIEYKFDYRQQ